MPLLNANRIIEADILTQAATRALLGSNGEARRVATILDNQCPMIAQGHTGTAEGAALEIDDWQCRQGFPPQRCEPDTHGLGVTRRRRIAARGHERGCGAGEEIGEESTTPGGNPQIDCSLLPFRDFDTLYRDTRQPSLATGGVEFGQTCFQSG